MSIKTIKFNKINTLYLNIKNKISYIIHNKNIRKLVFILAILLVYISFVFQLYKNHAIFFSMVFIIILFILIHFVYFDIQKIKMRSMFLWSIVVSLVIILIFSLYERHFILSILLINFGILIQISSLKDESNRIKFGAWRYFTIGGYLFTVFTTIGYSLVMLGFYSKFPYSCSDLSKASYSVVDFVSSPLKMGLVEVNDWKKGISDFFNSNIDDIVQDKKSGGFITKSISLLSTQFNSVKRMAIDQVLKDNNIINSGICEFLISEINKRYNAPIFQISVIMLMFLLLYGFVRVTFFVASLVSFLIFEILYIIGVYKKIKIQKEIEHID